MSHPSTGPAGTGPTTTATERAPYQYLALAIGALYLLIGLAGFLVTGFDGFAEHDPDKSLLGFHVNPLHNIVHLLIGAAGLALWRTRSGARTYGWLLAIGYGATFVYGLIAVNDPDINVLNINGADNVLHAVSALAGLAIALWPDRHRDRAGRV
ncbi:MAG: DUF4383 domain-containing protein [Actinotalea sp.]|nr:DUF4383 domain-containing protein [Actinotalea sp.]